MALNFPSSPSEGQKFSNFVFTGGLWKSSTEPRTALPFNRIVNGAMQVSQQSGNTAIGPGAAIIGYNADQWLINTNTSPGTMTAQRVQSVTPNGSMDRIRYTIGTAKAVLGASDTAQISQNIEGIRVADFRYGGIRAMQAILRFGWKSPAGTYSVCLQNGDFDRSYLTNFTVSAGQANTDTVQTLVIPGDASGTWLTDTRIGLTVSITLACGTAYHGMLGWWQAGSKLGTASGSNGMATAGAVFELFDVGLYLDPYLTGKPPPWEAVGDHKAQIDAMRYWCRTYEARGIVTAATSIGRVGDRHTVPMRIGPSVTLVGAVKAYDAAANTNMTVAANYPNTSYFELSGTTTGMTAFRGAMMFCTPVATVYAATSARM